MLIGKKFYFFLKLKFYFFYEWIKTAFKFYSNIKFLIFDFCFSFVYFFINPYRISRKFLEKKLHKKVYDYGETPLTQMEKIVKSFNINSYNKILELGAGRGKASFWLYFFTKCHITAIEQIPIFVKIANFFIKLFKIENVKFLCVDFFNYDFQNFDYVYLYGTTLSDEKIIKLINKLKKSSCEKIITVSYSLDEYDKSFICDKRVNVTFPWGQTKVYLNIKRS